MTHANAQPARRAECAPRLRASENEARIQSWEDEGGATAHSTGPRILIVDDEINSADTVARMLQALGYSQTRVAYSGRAGLKIAADFHPEVALVDLNLLGMTGYELAELLRDRAQTRGLRLIALTASSEHRGRERARVAGFERYLLKPVVPLDLSDLMERPSQ